MSIGDLSDEHLKRQHLAGQFHHWGALPRQPQQVVAHGDHGFARSSQHFSQTPLAELQCACQQQFDRADHCIHRHAKFMAHVGDDLAWLLGGRGEFLSAG